jgi:hypothetical protein
MVLQEFPDPSPLGAEIDGILADPAFEYMLAVRWLRIEDTQCDAEVLQKIVEEIIEMTEIELGLNLIGSRSTERLLPSVNG